MGAILHIQPADGEPFEVPISNSATIGRTRENTVCLSFSPEVSRQHAVIRVHNGWQYQLIDLGSRNGVYLDDARVVVPVILEDGARIRIADNLITFIERHDETTDEHLQVTIAGGPNSLATGVIPVALLVCDICNFNAMSEKTPPSQVAQLLGSWFREIAGVVGRVGGTLDKFIGDTLLAYWGNTANAKLNCGAAFAAARQMLTLAEKRRWPDGTDFPVCIALHHGPVTCSNVGIVAARDATIVGDPVNTTFRLESVAEELNERLVLSGDFCAQLPGAVALRDFGERALKGKSQLVRVYGLAE